MSGETKRRKRSRLRRILHNVRLNLAVFAVVIAMALGGIAILRSTLLRNTWDTGVSVANNYAAQESGELRVYETLLSFGAETLEQRIARGESREELMEWLDIYFGRLDDVLGEGVVDPYAVVDGKILAANPWEGDEGYDVYSTEWYQKAVAADGEVIFTSVYQDAIYEKPVITAAQKCGGADAVLAFDLLLEDIDFQFEDLDLSYGGSFFLCDGSGTVIYAETDLTVPQETLRAYLSGLIEKIEAGELEDYDDYITDLDGGRRAVYYARMDNGWYAIVTASYNSIFGGFRWLTVSFALVVAGFLAALAAMSWRDVKTSARVERTNETVRVLGNSYYALYRVDYQKETYEMIKGSDYVRGRIPPTGPYEDLLRTAGEVIEPDAFRDFAESLSAKNIRSLVSRRVRNFGGDFLRRFGDEMRWVNVRVLFDESLAPEEVVLCFQEVEEEKQRQLRERRLLEDALELARQNETSKQSFFSNMSHDMRTPLNAIVGLSELAGEHTGDQEKVAEYLQKINTASRQLLNLINDILDMSRVEHGKVTLTTKEFDLPQCVEECVESFRFQAEGEGKRLTLDLDVRDARVMGDPFRISQLLNNLLSNAVKFTSRGDSVQVSVTQVDQGERAKYRFVIADTGIGMSREFLPRLFEPYSREMRFTSRQISGTGLGMPITKALVAQMDGEIQVESEQGVGTTFTLVLPLAAAEPAEAPAPAAEAPEEAFSLEGKRILLAEDNEVNMEITTEILSMRGVEVVQAWNGREAVERFAEAEPFAFDAVLMDMQMPEMDGCAAARQIRALRRPDARAVPIIAVTANAFAEDVAATTAAGMDAHVSKPIDFNILCRTLERLTAAK